jgi:hypothetical protein
VQPSTGSGTEIFFSLSARNIAAGSGIFYSFTGTRYFFPSRNFIILSLFFNGHLKLNCVQNLNAKQTLYSFLYKRVTDPRVSLLRGQPELLP